MKAYLSPTKPDTKGELLEDFQPYCEPLGILYERWPVEMLDKDLCARIATDPGLAEPLMSQVLQAVKEPLDTLKRNQGYLTEDIVCLSAHTPNLNDILRKFDREHHHTDDEVRVVLTGSGVFGIVPEEETGLPPFELHVETGDLIVVPAYTRHWFTLARDWQQSQAQHPYIVALRVFKDKSGWVAKYSRHAV